MFTYLHNLAGKTNTVLYNATCVLTAVILAVTLLVPGTHTASAELAVVAELMSPKKTATEFPTSGSREAPRTMTIPVTAYNSLPEQTDSTPFHTADGTHVRDGIIAANFLPLDTRVKFPELYGDKEFVVKDRMNPRYKYKADIWMEDYGDAIQFGLQYTTIEIY